MPPTPLLGYNNNVRHRRRVFHIQTEDSGVASPRIMTHLFADGGRIVKSTRTDYSEFLEHGDMAAVVKNLMKEQHKAMFVALRSGALDQLIGFEDEPRSSDAPQTMTSVQLAGDADQASQLHSSPAHPSSSDQARTEPRFTSSSTKTAFVPSSQTKTGSPSSTDQGSSPNEANQQSRERAADLRPVESTEDPQASVPNSSYAPSRPAAIFSVPPPNSTGNIFGEVGLDEKSLDDTILSYLAEEPAIRKKKGDQ